MSGIIPEMEQIISQLERGTIVTTFLKKLEKKTLMIRRETRQIFWSQNATYKPFDGAGKLKSIAYCSVGIYAVHSSRVFWPPSGFASQISGAIKI